MRFGYFARSLLVRLVGLPVGGRRFRKPSLFASRRDPAVQMQQVAAASFYKKKIMSKAEYRVFKIAEAVVQERRNGCRVLSQTSLGEILGSDSKEAFLAVNSKRVDVLVINAYGDAVAAIEYQGAGHHQESAFLRDAIKKEALRKAGIQFIEISDTHSADEVATEVRRLFNPASDELWRRRAPDETRLSSSAQLIA